MKLKVSRYNYYIPYQQKKIVFNGLTGKFLYLKEEKAELFRRYTEHTECCDDKLRDGLLRSGFITYDHFNENEFFLSRRNTALNSSQYTLMILTSYDCNYSCWYCTQHHKKEYLSARIIARIKTHIQHYLIENQIEHFTISWFGGEPLLSFNDIITEIAGFSRQFCREHNIGFSNMITTNGSLITSDMMPDMKKFNFNFFQITIDGGREHHNQTKGDGKNASSFDIIMDNMLLLLYNLPGARIVLRFNYTDKNIMPEKIVNDLNEKIPENLRNRIEFLPRKVWQIEGNTVNLDHLYELKKIILRNGYKLITNPVTEKYACYVEKKHYNTIFHTGKAGKCSNIDPKQAPGVLNEDGRICWETEPDYSLTRKCKECGYLPVCKGGCPEYRKTKTGEMRHCPDKRELNNQITEYCGDMILQTEFKETVG